MKQILFYLRDFLRLDFQIKIYAIVLVLLALAIVFNFKYDFEDTIVDAGRGTWISWPKYFLFYASAYIPVLCIYYALGFCRDQMKRLRFWLFVLASLLVLSFKVFFHWHTNFIPEAAVSYERYWYGLLLKRVFSISIYSAGILLCYYLFRRMDGKFFGMTQRNFDWRPYLFMLLFMIPLLIWASGQSDFLQNYPRLRLNLFPEAVYWKYFIRYEPFYLLDFITLEWFFRGLLVIGMIQLLGHRAVLPMAVLYCTFHFGKPMAECISSFFGGYILGVIAYYSRSIWGGIIVHMGIAFMMDIAAYISHTFVQ